MTKIFNILFSLTPFLAIAVFTNVLSGVVYWYILAIIFIILILHYNYYTPIIKVLLWLYIIAYIVILFNKMIFKHVNPVHLLCWEILLILATLVSIRMVTIVLKKTEMLKPRMPLLTENEKLYISLSLITVVVVTMFYTTKINAMFCYILCIIMTIMSTIIINTFVTSKQRKIVLSITYAFLFICCVPTSHPIFTIGLLVLAIISSLMSITKKYWIISILFLILIIGMLYTCLLKERTLFIAISTIWIVLESMLIFKSGKKGLN